ncbi:unnamed protein product, partial [Didymodactylos carnosus]
SDNASATNSTTAATANDFRTVAQEDLHKKIRAVYERVADQYHIESRHVVECLIRKRKRNDETHFADGSITDFIKDKRQSEQSNDVVAYFKTKLNGTLTDDESSTIKLMYNGYCKKLLLDKADRWNISFRPTDYVWIQTTDNEVSNYIIKFLKKTEFHEL